jgi:hypothetical protein
MTTLPFTGVRQAPHANLCWAAVTAGVFNFYERSQAVRLCDVASAVRGERCCDPVPPHCDARAALDRGLRRFGLLAAMRPGVIGLRAGGAVPTIESEITVGRPIGVGVTFGLMDHFCVIFGFDPQTGALALADPFFDNALSISYTQLRTNYRDGGRWIATYFTRLPPQD